MKTLDYFLKYITFSTQSKEENNSSPSTENQTILAKEILNDLFLLGYKDAYIDEFSQVHLFISGEDGLETIGFNAHIDTAPDFSGENVKYQIIKNYDLSDIKLNEQRTLSPKQFDILNKFKNKTLITTCGDTLLGADDKAGISIIMNVLRFLKENPTFKHHPISILFTCDEEVGRGGEHFDNNIFKADYAYTVDGASPYSVSYENFYAASVNVNIKGVSVHPGEAKGKLVNALLIANELIDNIDFSLVPETSEGYDGYIFLNGIMGNNAEANLYFIARDFDLDNLNNQLAKITQKVDILKEKHQNCAFSYEINYQYKNMYPILKEHPSAINKIEKAYKSLGLNFKKEPIRGGTDGATFSYKGCPTPNLGTGSYNHHGPYEFLVKEEHDLMISLIQEIIKA